MASMKRQRPATYISKRVLYFIILCSLQEPSNGFTLLRTIRRHQRCLSLAATTIDTFQGPFCPCLLASHWGRRPLLIQSAFDSSELQETCLSWNDLQALACEEDADSRRITHTPGDLSSYSLDVGPFCSKDLQHPADNVWTLLVNDVDRFHPPLSDWIEDRFGFIPRWRRDDAQVSLAPCGGGIGPHVDNYDVFLIQVSGKRRWQVGMEPISVAQERRHLVPGIDVSILDTWDNYSEVVLEEGDVLYLPPRWTHCGTSQSDDCMTLSVGCRAPSASELVSRIAEKMTESVRESAVRRFQDVDLLQQNNAITNSEITNETTDQMRKMVLNAVHDTVNDDKVWNQLVGEIVTQPNRPRDGYLIPLEEQDEHDLVQAVLNGTGVLYRAEGVSFAFSTQGGRCRLYANGQSFQVATTSDHEEVKSVLSSIVQEPCIRDDLFESCSLNTRKSVVSLLEQLVQEGLLYASDEE